MEFTKKNMCLKAIKSLNQLLYKGRTIIVDIAVSKDEYQSANPDSKDLKAEQPATKMEVEEETKQAKQVSKHDKKTEKVPKDGKVEAKEASTEPKGDEDLSNTIFIRNLPLTVTEDELYRFCRKYGKIKFAKVVVDRETEEPKGTAFVKFRESAPAQMLINYSRDYEQTMNSQVFKKFEMDANINLEIEGRIVKIFPAESKTALGERLEDREQKDKDSKTKAKKVKPLKKIKHIDELVAFDKHNKRNLELALEGISRGETWMHPVDKDKFENLYREKVEKLKNPNNFVSKTRIIFKYLERTVTEEAIRSMCFAYLDAVPEKRRHLVYVPSAPIQCKLMLDDSRTKSIGIAFVEFSKPELSLGFLQWVKENRQSLFPQKGAVLAEFVIQDARKISVLAKKIKKVK